MPESPEEKKQMMRNIERNAVKALTNAFVERVEKLREEKLQENVQKEERSQKKSRGR